MRAPFGEVGHAGRKPARVQRQAHDVDGRFEQIGGDAVVEFRQRRVAGDDVPCMDGARGARGESDVLRSVRVQPCIRPLNAAVMAAGPDVIR